MRKKLFITAIFIFAGVFSVTAQLKEFKFKNFTQEEGLPSNECYFVYCDSKNFIWMATETGVVRFDGNKLEHFDLPDNIVFKIREDKKGRIWFFSQSGKFAYFFKEHIYAYKYNDIIAPHLKDILITNAYVNDNDEVIINSAGLWNYRISKSGTIERIEYLYKKISDRSIINITQIDSTDVFARFQLLNEWNSSLQININENGRRLTYNVPFEKGAYQQYG